MGKHSEEKFTSPKKGVRRRLPAGGIAVLLTIATVAQSGGAALKPPRCGRMVASPRYEENSRLYCLAEISPFDGESRFELSVSSDRGETWGPLPTDGLNDGDKFQAIDFVVLPERTVRQEDPIVEVDALFVRIVHGEDRGLYKSSDLGKTWMLVDKILGEPIYTRQLSTYIDSPAGLGWILYAGAAPARMRPPPSINP